MFAALRVRVVVRVHECYPWAHMNPSSRIPAFAPLLSALALLTLLVTTSCVSVGIEVKQPARGLSVEPLVVFVHEGTFGGKQARSLAAVLHEELAGAGIEASLVVVGEAELKHDATLNEARAGRRALLRLIPLSGARMEGGVSRIHYDATLVSLPDEAVLWRADLKGRSGVLTGPMRRRQRRLGRALSEELAVAVAGAK